MSFVNKAKRIAAATALLTVLPVFAAAGEKADLYSDSSKVAPVTELQFYQNKEGL